MPNPWHTRNGPRRRDRARSSHWGMAPQYCRQSPQSRKHTRIDGQCTTHGRCTRRDIKSAAMQRGASSPRHPTLAHIRTGRRDTARAMSNPMGMADVRRTRRHSSRSGTGSDRRGTLHGQSSRHGNLLPSLPGRTQDRQNDPHRGNDPRGRCRDPSRAHRPDTAAAPSSRRPSSPEHTRSCQSDTRLVHCSRLGKLSPGAPPLRAGNGHQKSRGRKNTQARQICRRCIVHAASSPTCTRDHTRDRRSLRCRRKRRQGRRRALSSCSHIATRRRCQRASAHALRSSRHRSRRGAAPA